MTASATKSLILGMSRKSALFWCVQLLALIAIYQSTQSQNFFTSFVDDNYPPSSYNTRTVAAVMPFTPQVTTKRLPTLDELASVSGKYRCPKGSEMFQNIVLPQNITHANRKIPKVVHITAKTCCVTSEVKTHIMKWKLPDHSLYLHDNAAVYKLFDYSVNDRYGNELVQNLFKTATCMTNGATLSDLWRYLALYYYGGIYTDLDNSPGVNYTIEFIQPNTDSFFFVEAIGTMTQYYMASSKHHPVLLQFLKSCVDALHASTNNVMVNNPPAITGPGAVKRGMVKFRRAINVDSDGYEPAGIYDGALDAETKSALPWYTSYYTVEHDNFDKEYPSPSELLNRTVTIVGQKGGIQARTYIERSGLQARAKTQAWKEMNMTHYHGSYKRFPKANKISCQQHASRMMALLSTNTSFYYNKRGIANLVANYRRNKSDKHYYDVNTDEMLIPWKKEEKEEEKK